jgi:hypothetical protein
VDANFMQELVGTYGNPSRFSELVFGTPFHAGQRRYAAMALADVNFLLPGNSWGKTEFITRFALYCAFHKVGPFSPTNMADFLGQEYKVLVCSYNYPIAKESFDRLEAHYINRPEVAALIKSFNKADNRVLLANGAQIDWGSLDGQGRLVEAARRRVILVDEAGHIPDISSTFDNILFPRTMGVGGRIHLLGTPKAHSDPYLFEIYQKGRDGKDPFYYSQSGSVLENEFWPQSERERVLRNPRYVKGWEPCPDCPGLADLDHLACREQDGVMNRPLLTQMGKQVINGEFIIAGGLFFNRFHIARVFREGEHLDVDWSSENSFRREPEENHLYLGAYDLGGNKPRRKRKTQSDPTVGFVIDYTTRPWQIVRWEYIEGGEADWQGKYEVMAKDFHDYAMPYLLIDATGTVDSVQEALQDRGVEVEGVHFGGSSGKKFDMLRNLQLVTELEWGQQRGVLRSPPIPRLKHELDHYLLPDDDIKQDCVMALAMVCHHISQWEMPAAISGEVF